MTQSINYRPEIDGLRAIAVISVLLFHAGILLPGGYVGVDIFFVISGYLITAIIVAELESGRFSFIRFYERRIRRLVPPLIPVVAVTTAASFVLLPNLQFQAYVESVWASATFVANWYFLSTVGYFDGPGERTPLLHLWSLAIEEQFYFIFPIVLMVMVKRGRRVLLLFAVAAALASFAYSAYLVSAGQPTQAFYNSAARFWELLIGSLIAVAAIRPPRRAWMADALELSGIALILFAIGLYTERTSFPGAAALVPTIGTAFLICAAGRGRIIAPVLRSPPFAGIGLISYALYLWHWPILSFIHILFPQAGRGVPILGLFLAAALAAASYHLIERPTRTGSAIRTARSAYTLAASYVVVAVAVTAAGMSGAVDARRNIALTYVRSLIYDQDRALVLAKVERMNEHYKTELNLNFTGASADFNAEQHLGWTCSYDDGNAFERIQACLDHGIGRGAFLVIGDSVGRDTFHALRAGFPGERFVMLHHSSCPPADAMGAVRHCFPRLEETLRPFRKRLSGTILSFRYHRADWGNITVGIPSLKRVTDNLILFGVSPVFSSPIDEMIKAQDEKEPLPIFISMDDTLLNQWDYDHLAKKAADVARRNGVPFLNVTEFFCPARQCRLWAETGNMDPLYIDQQHLSNVGIQEFSDYLRASKALQVFLKNGQQRPLSRKSASAVLSATASY